MTCTRPLFTRRAQDPHGAPAEAAVFVLTQDARRALRRRFDLEDAPLERALGLLGASSVEGPDAPDGLIDADAKELLARLHSKAFPWFIHACPCWQRDALRREPSLAAYFSPPRPAPRAPRVAIVGCPARKAALLSNGGWAGALTVREAGLLLMQSGVRPAQKRSQVDSAACWLERVTARAQQLLDGSVARPLVFQPETGVAGVETARFTLLGRELAAARIRGAARLERFWALQGAASLPWQLIEVLACASGCERD